VLKLIVIALARNDRSPLHPGVVATGFEVIDGQLVTVNCGGFGEERQALQGKVADEREITYPCERMDNLAGADDKEGSAGSS
jgi:hypothetical protein